MAFAQLPAARALARPAAPSARCRPGAACCQPAARLGVFRAVPPAALRAAPARRPRGLSVITRAEQVRARARQPRALACRAAPGGAQPSAATRALADATPRAQDYYQILGVPRGSDVKEMKKAYRQLARKFHPVRARRCAQPPSPVRTRGSQSAFRAAAGREQGARR